MSRSGIAIILIIIGFFGFFFGSAWWTSRNYLPSGIKQHQDLMKTLSKGASITTFQEHYPETRGLDWYACLDWMAPRIIYPKAGDENLEYAWDLKERYEGRSQDPIEILESEYPIMGQVDTPEGPRTLRMALGRCGEFSIVYMQLLLANGYIPYFVVGEHENGDHVWIELKGNQNFIIDPTDAVTWRQKNASSPWSDCPDIGHDPRLVQNVTWKWVYRISLDEIVNVTDEYNGGI